MLLVNKPFLYYLYIDVLSLSHNKYMPFLNCTLSLTMQDCGGRTCSHRVSGNDKLIKMIKMIIKKK